MSDLFIGARLGAARVKAGITLEQAAKDTHIRVQRLREIEADDFSAFVHPTYVRLFLLDYANYLGVPAEEVRPMLPERAGAAPGGFQYLDALAAHTWAKQEPRRRRRRLLVFIARILLLLLLLIAGGTVWFTLKKIERVTGRGESPAPSPSGNATPSPTPAPTPPPVEVPETPVEAPAEIPTVVAPPVEEPIGEPDAPPALPPTL